MTEKKLTSYYRRAQVVAENSPDAETKVGSVLISRSTGSVISEGYNGFARNVRDNILPKTRPDKYTFMIHAEENLVANAARNGVRTDDCFVVQTISPCPRCARLLYQSGITEVYCRELYHGSTMEDDDLYMAQEFVGQFYKLTISPNRG